ncbi:MAG: KamA family radical SAM protein [Desulfobacteraceae bacterium]|jgi:lysine 2,3-aminomutase
MNEWRALDRDAITTPEELSKALNVDVTKIRQVQKQFPFRVNRYYLSLIREVGDPIWKQAIPDPKELINNGFEDPLAEEHDSPVPNITHRYPDRVLFYVSSLCAMYCRFCTRKRKVSDPKSVYDNGIESGLKYIREHKIIRDVIVSGGDPLLLTNKKIEYILKSLRRIQHIEIIRIGTRTPVTLPQRITAKLCEILKQYHPLYINTHFNHPREITPESKKACARLADAGIPLGNQTVLLKGVNDTPQVMKKLLQMLLTIRVKPYYIYQVDLVKGTEHFRTPVQTGLNIIQAVRGYTSGMAVPHFVIDAPGGGGKIPLMPDPIVCCKDNNIYLKNFEGNIFTYPSVSDITNKKDIFKNSIKLPAAIIEKQKKLKNSDLIGEENRIA